MLKFKLVNHTFLRLTLIYPSFLFKQKKLFMEIRAFEREKDLQNVLKLNQRLVELLSPMTAHQFDNINEDNSHVLVAEEDGQFAGFFMLVKSNADYESENFRWFQKRYDNFIYVDRVAVANEFRGRGIGSEFYQRAFDYAEKNNIDYMFAEIHMDPPNEKSLAFHDSLGFVEEGTAVLKGDHHYSLQKKVFNPAVEKSA
ncbi:hypothetical protein GCM10011365_13320 [Marinicella pacifica]|uniref:N-acetyltransferase domain-containing protein n=2 Tax=Marinicella pacifica TaxID=1171543 RepID=A0A917CQ38_9GAMM|nr:hypothetical protein GCM10011365_13320 [Marinicella pacifica]